MSAEEAAPTLRDPALRRAVVTGAASGIGHATVELLRADGVTVVGIDRTALDPDGDQASHGIRADLQDAAAIDRAVDRAVAVLGGPPDLLVNAAGIYLVRSLLDTTAEDWDAVQATNLRATFLVSRAAVQRGMSHGATIVNLSSVAAYRGSADEPSGAYNASKAAVSNLTGQMAAEWAPRGIRVVAIAPGVIDTPMLRLMDDPAAGAAFLQTGVPLRRLGTAAEVASVIRFAASDEAAYLTGTTIVVDGGLLAV